MTEGLISSWSSEDTDLSEVLARLERLRREADRTASRAAVVNLVVVAAVDAAADRVVASVGGLGAHHPGRIVVLVPCTDAGDAAAGPGLAARAELRESDVSGRDLWWEVVVLRARGPVCGHLESLMEPLLLHDLPVSLWLAGGTSSVDSPAVVDGADQVIVSGERAAATGRAGVAADLGRLVGRRPVADLAWLAIEPTRRALARLFDPPERRAGLAEAAVTVAGPPWTSRLLAGWLVDRAGIDPGRVTLGPESGPGLLRAEIDLGGRAAVLDAGSVWPAGAGGPAPSGPGAAEARLGPATVVVPHRGSETPRLLAAALTHPGRDTRYEAALAAAADM